MATKAKVRKPNTALVFNPSRGLSIGGRKAARKSNPTPRKKTASAISNPRHKKRHHRRRRNPSSSTWLSNPSASALMGAVFAGAGFSFLNLGLARIMPSGSPYVQIGLKLGVGFIVQSFGNRVPIFGKYKDGIAFLLFALAAKEAVDTFVLPTVRSTFSQVTGQVTNLFAPPAAMAGLRYPQAIRRY